MFLKNKSFNKFRHKISTFVVFSPSKEGWMKDHFKVRDFIIFSISDEEEKILIKNNIRFTVRSTTSYLNKGKDIEIRTTRTKIEKVFAMLNRDSSYPKTDLMITIGELGELKKMRLSSKGE